MSHATNASFETLPVEIFHRIFDNLDAQTIVFSIRSVCRLFQRIVNTYNRYNLDFKSISKSDFHRFCHSINPQNVTSLRLCDDEQTPNQIALFMSLVRLRQFSRLHAISFLGIAEFQLNMILKRMHLNCLTSFSLNIQQYDSRRRKTTLKFLSSILAHPSLRKVELNIKNDLIHNISWPTNVQLVHLTIDSDISFDTMLTILSCSSQLHTLVLKQNLPRLMYKTKQTFSFPQLTALTIENLNDTMDKLESFLLCLPLLIDLKLIGEHCDLDGKRCQQFIQMNLPYLNNFQFFIDIIKSTLQTLNDLEQIIESFRNPFWTDYKKWFVAAQLKSDPSYCIQIYSIPICKSVLRYEFNSYNIFRSNSAILSNNDPLIIKNINELIFPLKSSTYRIMNEDELATNTPRYFNVTKIDVTIDRRTILDSLKFLTSVVDVSKLVEVKLESFYFNKDNQTMLFEIVSILDQARSLLSLVVHSNYCKYELYPYLNRLCSIIPRQLKHLRMPANELNQIEVIFERCQNLSIVQFEITRTKFSLEVIKWFNQHTADSAFRRHVGCDTIWIGTKNILIKENHKRIKLDENQSDN
ncbi:unnamed protein product [Rotaria socialis]|uniref:F-box domain-containing protein n=1 Tax=Rotaria socialis TaxID=392032 RepID=A0A821RSL9_9BILA|nr:unnamed protein product [Rotaria socialis]CAF4843681.1 unnamed protein product [Rotaria socialis]